jgi:FkbM family methyltransferase
VRKPADLTVSLADGVKIVVPDDLRLITPYVLQEQGDWFEDEIRFVRAWAKPGFRALDVGANYGVYALTMAQRAGSSGRVWAVEPGADVLACLARSIQANGFSNVELLPVALSREDGRGTLGGALHPEVRRLASQTAGGQAVEIRSLDRIAADCRIERVDFVKIDAEGEELNIVEGGAGFLARESPLLMLELKSLLSMDKAVVTPLARLGYACYRLLPEMHLLVPFPEHEAPDAYLLNAFFAKPDRARALHDAGLLALEHKPAASPATPAAIGRLLEQPYAREFAGRWREWLDAAATQGPERDYALALASYCAACDTSAAPEARVANLEAAYLALGQVARAQPSPARLASFARVASASGHRTEAIEAAKQLAAGLSRAAPADPLAEPALPPAVAYDTILPQGDAAHWLLWAAIEYVETAEFHSGYYRPRFFADELGLEPDRRFVTTAFLQRAALRRRRDADVRQAAAALSPAAAMQSAQTLAQQGNFAEARDALLGVENAITTNADASVLLGHVARMANDAPVARRAYESALALDPDRAEARIGLSLVLMSLFELEAARTALEGVRPAQPEYGLARTNLAKIVYDLGDFKAALAILQEVLARTPDNPEVRLARADVLFALGRTADAQQAYTDTLRRMANPAPVGLALAKQKQQAGDVAHARVIARAARILAPRDTPLMTIAAALAIDASDIDEARRLIDQALALAPQDAAVWHVRGLASGYEGDYRRAQAELEKSLQLDTSDASAVWGNLGWLHFRFGNHRAATDAYQRAVGPGTVAGPELQSSFLMSLRFWPAYPPAQTFEIFRQWGALMEGAVSGLRADRRALMPRTPRAKIRVGYLTEDFREHSVMYFLEPVLKHHDRQRFEIHCYHLGRREDFVTARIKGVADQWRNVFRMEIARMLKMIRDDELDILIDLAGHVQGNHLALFASRAAFVQGTWLGCPGTTGLTQMDFKFVDGLVDPPGVSEPLYTEKLVRLPQVFCVYEPPAGAPDPLPPPSLASGHITFGCFNNPAKFSDVALKAWGQVMQAVPASRLLLKATGFEVVKRQAAWRERLAAFGIAPDRVEFSGWAGTTLDHLAEYGRVDIALDPTPYNGVTTTCEALWMGVPVVTMWGQEHAGRVAGDFLTTIGNGDLVGQNAADFVRIAAELARDPARLTRLRTELRESMRASPLMDYANFTRDVEAAYEAILADAKAKFGAARP